VLNDQEGLPTRAGSEYEDDLRAYGAGRYVPTAPTDLRAFAAQLDLITASEFEDALWACANMDDLHACIAMMDLFMSRMDDEDEARKNELLCVLDTKDLVPEQAAAPPGSDEFTFKQLGDLKAEMRADTFEKLGEMRADTFEQLGDLNVRMDEQLGDLNAKMDEQLGDLHAKMRIQADKDEARELEAQERLCAQDKDNAQYLEQKNDGLRIQAGSHVAIAAAESEMGVSCGREMTDSVKIFAVAPQDLCILKSTAADAPMGSTLNEPESRAFTAGPRPHAFGSKNVNLTVYSRAKVKVGPLARIRIDDEVYT